MARLLAQVLWLVAAALLAFAPGVVARADDGLPKIVGHSDLEFGVYKGDQLTVEARTEGDKVEVKWLTGNETICRTAICEIDTSAWSIGTHKVTLVVLNDKGSLSLRYSIKLLEAPVAYKPGKVKPRLVDAGEGIERTDNDDLVVRTVEGRGFSYNRHKLQVVGNLARVLEWQEKLKTQPGSILWFGRGGAESHVLGAETVAYLAKGGSGRRAIVLESGVLRSRQLDGQAPRWSILAGDWLQIDGDSLADVLVLKKAADEDKLTVVVLRGAARVFHKRPDAVKDDTDVGESPVAGAARFLPQGVVATFAKENPDDGEPTLPVAKTVAKHIKMSTPFYARGQRAGGEHLQQTLLRDKTPGDFAAALALAEEANATRDFVTTIEALAPYQGDVKKSFKGAMLLGHAYRGIFLHEDAFHFYKAAAKLKPEAPEPPFAMAVMYLGDRNWKKAATYLERAEDNDHPDEQLLQYYLGVARHRLGEGLAADSHFEYALWAGGRPEVSESARAFRQEVAADGWFDLRLGLGLFMDTNTLRAGAATQDVLKQRSPTPIKSVSSMGYDGLAGFSLWAVRTRGARFALVFDIAKTGYANSELKDVEPLDQALGLEMGLGFGGESGAKPLLGISGGVKAQMIFVGSERAVDRLGAHLGIGSPALFGLELGLRSDLNLDPLPARDDVYDPVLEEVVEAGERSNRQLFYRLSATPVESDAFELGLGVESGAAAYRSELHHDENYAELDVALDLAYKPGLRHRVELDVMSRQRQFKESADGRKDQNLALALLWVMRYTTSLRGQLGLLQETQSSSRKANQYSRQLYSYGVRLEL
jgi:tetratricopeptide (TPR) repeat protein